MHADQDIVELFEARSPKLSEVVKPVDGGRHFFGLQRRRAALFVNVSLDQACAFQYFQVPGNGGLTDFKWCSDLIHRRLTIRQPQQYRPSRRICQCRKNNVKVCLGFHITNLFHNNIVIYKDNLVNPWRLAPAIEVRCFLPCNKSMDMLKSAMTPIHRAITRLLAAIALFSVVWADGQANDDSCAKPHLTIDFADETQVQLLAHDFAAYESCITDFILTTGDFVVARREAVERAVADESLSVEQIEAELVTLVEYQEAAGRAKQDLKTVIDAILEDVPARVFNQWDAESKVAEP